MYIDSKISSKNNVCINHLKIVDKKSNKFWIQKYKKVIYLFIIIYSSSWLLSSVTGVEGFSLCCTQTAGTTKSMAYSHRLGSDADINAGSKPQFKRTCFKHELIYYLFIYNIKK